MIIAVCVYVACIYLMNLANSVNALTAWSCVIGWGIMWVSTYKFEGGFFRHERRIATKFGTHVRIETRLALT